LKRRTAVKRNYHTIASTGKANERKLAEFLSHNGQFLLPMVDLIEQSRMAVEELIDVAGRVTIEAVLNLSAQQVAETHVRECASMPSALNRSSGLRRYWMVTAIMRAK
jgi:hypothetical protein